MFNPINLLFAFILLMIAEGFIKPIAIGVWERAVVPNLDEVFSIINPKMGEWLQEKNANELNDAIIDAIAETIPEFPQKSELVKNYAVSLVRKKYDPVINAKLENGQTEEVPVIPLIVELLS